MFFFQFTAVFLTCHSLYFYFAIDIHDAYKINIESIDPSKDISMREVYGLNKLLSE